MTGALKLFFILPFALTLACSAAGGDYDESEPVTSNVDELQPIKACPAIAILCIEGYRVKQLPNCDQICVPDQAFECNADADCGAIYCITTPCPQPVCRGHKCVLSDQPVTPGQPCGDKVCGSGQYCCNASCGLCAPLDGACIQIACL